MDALSAGTHTVHGDMGDTVADDAAVNLVADNLVWNHLFRFEKSGINHVQVP